MHELAAGNASSESRFRLLITAEDLLRRRPADQPGRIARALRKAVIDLNPHQVDAAVTALGSLRGRGLVLADEVGLGKTIEAGLVLAQLVAEGRRHLLVLSPASLRLQWQRELDEKLGLDGMVVDGKLDNRERRGSRQGSVFDRPGQIVIASHPFAARRAEELRRIPWDCIIIDEAHRLRGAHRGSKTALALRDAFESRPKLLLTATPLQNGLGELYGILSLLDRDALGPFEDFRRLYPDSQEPDSYSALKNRVRPMVHRTLRRQVKEYVRYTERRSIVAEFSPTAEEQRLYDEVSDYLCDEDTFAIHPARRALMVMVYRKLLASSPAAIAATLNRLVGGLEDRLERGEFVDAPDDDEREIMEVLEEDGIDAHQTPKKVAKPATPAALNHEVGRLRELAKLAESIDRPAKTEALLSAIDRAFTEAVRRNWPQKAVVFTESRRTQVALQKALEGEGHTVLLLNGGSGGAEARAALVDGFRDHAQILILTEAGAEGLNLQFANLVVNYDLPWNPQRIEQRIGRCHRYGQTRDVVVLNFLASGNAAEARLYDLLSKKLELFDGMFGATDEPLGALGDGASFEKRVYEIFDDCRDPSAIEIAFDALQTEVEGKISAGMARARSQLCDHFDDEIRAKLKMTGSETEKILDADERALVSLVQGAIPGAAIDGDGKLHIPAAQGGAILETSYRTASKRDTFLTIDHPVAQGVIERLGEERGSDARYVLFEYTAGGHKISRVVPLLGSEGWWLVYRVSFDGCLEEDHVVHVVVAKTADGQTVILDEAQIASLLHVRSRDIPRRSGLRAATLASTHGEAALESRVQGIARDARTRADQARREAKEAIEVGFEDRLAALQSRTDAASGAWKRARERRENGDADRAFRELSRTIERESAERKRAIATRSERQRALEKNGQLRMARTLIATAYFWLE